MPNLSGKIIDVCGALVSASEIVRVDVKAPSARASVDALVVSAPVPVAASSTFTISVQVGEAILTVRTQKSVDRFLLRVESGMTSLSQAVVRKL